MKDLGFSLLGRALSRAPCNTDKPLSEGDSPRIVASGFVGSNLFFLMVEAPSTPINVTKLLMSPLYPPDLKVS